MELRTLGKTTWNKLKVGEVFGKDGCFEIYAKLSKNVALLLTNDHDYYDELVGTQHHYIHYFILDNRLYKLSKEIQALWKTE